MSRLGGRAKEALGGGRSRRRAAVAILALAAIAAGLALGAGAEAPDGPEVAAVPLDARSPRAPAGREVRVLVDLDRPSLGERMDERRIEPAEQRAYVRSLGREARALQSALRAKGVRLEDPVVLTRVWSGFATTVRTDDLPALQTLGARAEPVRRFYPAAQAAGGPPVTAGPPDAGRAAGHAGDRDGAPRIALLDAGVDVRVGALRRRIVPGFDALPRTGRSRDAHGTVLAGVLADALGPAERILAVRVAAPQTDAESGVAAEFARSDTVLQGLERSVDPDGDGDAEDAVAVALVGVNSPYAGFARTPEAEAAAGAAALGTLVVAPAGNQGPRSGRFGTVGSPAAAPDALAVGALVGPPAPARPGVRLGLAGDRGRGVLDGVLLGGGARPVRAGLTGLAGPSQERPSAAPGARGTGARPLEYFDVDAAPRARGRVVVVPARGADGRAPDPAARVGAAAAAGAAALVVCEPDPAGRLEPVAGGVAGGMPVVGLRGGDARRALELSRGGGGVAFVSAPRPREPVGEVVAPARASSAGPTYALGLKPDVTAPGTARVRSVTGAPAFAAGSSVAAARAAATALAVHRARPTARPHELAAALVGTATGRGPLLSAGAGEPAAARALAAPVLATPHTVAFGLQRPDRRWRVRRTVTLLNPGRRAVSVRLGARLDGSAGARAAVSPARLRLAPGARRPVELRLAAGAPLGARTLTGRLSAAASGPAPTVSVPFAVPVGPPPPAPLGALRLIRDGDRRGVRFAAGDVDRRAGDALAVLPLGSLVLSLLGPGGERVRDLTPAGGARDLLPGEYAYTLTAEALDGLEPGRYRFEARARAVVGGARAVRRSPGFEVR